MKVLSLFDGISCARVALERVGIPVEAYYASEVDKYAIQIAQKNYPDTIQLGDVRNINGKDFIGIDLLIGGFPCQDLSVAKKDRKGLQGERSALFWEMVRIQNECKPKYFVYENVASMPKKDKQIITETLGVEPVMINAALVSAQNRKRLFWVGRLVGDKYEQVVIPQPGDRGILLKDILEPKVDDAFIVKPKSNTVRSSDRGSGINDKHNWDTIRIGQIGKGGQADRIYSPEGKSVGLSALGGGRGAKMGLYAVAPNGKQIILGNGKLQVLKEGRTEEGKKLRREIRQKTGRDSTLRSKEHKAYFGREGKKANCITTGLGVEGFIVEDYVIRKLTPIECERLQCLPDNWTEGVSNTQRYKMLGNAFNVDVVAHILKYLSPTSGG